MSKESMSLEDLRAEIDRLDQQLVRVLNERVSHALEIGRLKNKDRSAVYVPAREKQVLDRVSSYNDGPLTDSMLHAIYREIMSGSIALERKISIAYLGPPATFSHQAARNKFGSSVDYQACNTIGDVFLAVQGESAEYGVVPIENSTEGAVTYTLDQFINTPVKICAEILLPVSQNLLAKGPQEEIETIYSHQQVFGQCRRWLQENMPSVKQVPVSSTAAAARMAAEEAGTGALASRLAGEMNDLNVLAGDVQDLMGNTTRFLVIGRQAGKPSGRDKTSVFFSVKHRAGALHDSLVPFRKNGINLSKIESRPSKEKAWEYYFFVDIEGHVDDEPVRKSIDELKEHCSVLTILGSYPNAAPPPE
ncbi:MAG: prephenate dehydratase [Verrucomicrobiota bacterium]